MWYELWHEGGEVFEYIGGPDDDKPVRFNTDGEVEKAITDYDWEGEGWRAQLIDWCTTCKRFTPWEVLRGPSPRGVTDYICGPCEANAKVGGK